MIFYFIKWNQPIRILYSLFLFTKVSVLLILFLRLVQVIHCSDDVCFTIYPKTANNNNRSIIINQTNGLPYILWTTRFDKPSTIQMNIQILCIPYAYIRLDKQFQWFINWKYLFFCIFCLILTISFSRCSTFWAWFWNDFNCNFRCIIPSCLSCSL